MWTYWSLTPDAIAQRLGVGLDGLTSADAGRRLEQFGRNELREHDSASRWSVFVRQLRSPLLLLLVFAAIAAGLSGEWLDAVIVTAIVALTVTLGSAREYSANAAAAALRARLQSRASVMRDGRVQSIATADVVPGDLVALSAGTLIPADAIIVDATDLFVGESVLTGESFPVQKMPGAAEASATLVQRRNCVFLGTSVRSGNARCLVVATGQATEFGRIARRLDLRPPEAEFDRGIRQFGYLLTISMLVIVLVVFVTHVLMHRPPVETLLFSVALAVGLSPELLPAILSVNLARGAEAMAKRGVLVRRLNAIENLGSMDVLCTDKTGTLTEGVVRLEGAYDAWAQPSDAVLDLGAWNAALETGVASALDDAITTARPMQVGGEKKKLGEIPFDFARKRVSIVMQDAQGAVLIAKGAFAEMLDVCAHMPDGSPLTAAERGRIEGCHAEWASAGIRVLAVATRRVPPGEMLNKDAERDLTFMGFLTFLDRPKAGVTEALAGLRELGVSIKLITGDSGLVATHLSRLVGFPASRILSGREVALLHDAALAAVAPGTDLFVEVDPAQKERIIRSLKMAGHVVGFVGDGINDAPAMHAADTSLAVEHAVDVARDTADFVLLEEGLDVIRGGIEEGRKTFANTMKYVLMTTSANLGNMISMAAASLFLPFLPLTAAQILLNNFLSDIPAVGIADDTVDAELVATPNRWDVRFIGRYMVQFGLLSSLFDAMTFAVLLWLFHASEAQFRTAWFVESLLTELVVALVVRTRRAFYRSHVGRLLLVSTLALIPIAFAAPYLPYAGLLGFVPLPLTWLAVVGGITVMYVAATELQKRRFFAITP